MSCTSKGEIQYIENKYIYPYHACMAYFPTFGLFFNGKIWQMYSNIPYMDGKGKIL